MSTPPLPAPLLGRSPEPPTLDEELLQTQLVMGRVILNQGDSGLVTRATLAGQPAVVKLYGPDQDGLEAYCTEFSTYRALEELQGDIVPVLLAAGRPRPERERHLYAIATRLVPGRSLDLVVYERRLEEQEGEAAMEALRRLHAAVPGFLHGDVGPENVVMVEQEAGQPPRCVILDFGVARLDATREDQEEEMLQMEVELDLDEQEEEA